ncbi:MULTISPECIES: AfsR/SARP family transcriptional regulator [Streptomyces]|uniref:AfsR/SARP family transcriptional regulator n=1 Tax=Streptomyces TaxID=1883 RepID=UPI000BEF4CC4|nr:MULTISPECIES: AfsR/SARP family transcriptional regulator [unclassified Streptomyces]WTE27914.1 AfsR/SARP family transcriptional regulator [Streptomyces anulatus]
MSGRQYGERRLEFRILGPTELLVDGVPVPLTAPKLRTVLVALLLSRGRLVSDVSLSELLWGPLPPATMAAQLYTYISRLRRSCEPGLDVRRGLRGYRLDIGTAGFDLHHFQRAADRGRQSLRDGQYAMAAGQLASALSLWRGPALADVTESLTAAELPCLEESRLSVQEDRIEADLAVGRHARVLTELVGLVAEHPVRESLRGQLMTALYRVGRLADALRVYEQGRRLLKGELGIEPGAVLRDLHRAVLLENLPEPVSSAPVVVHAPQVEALRPVADAVVPDDLWGGLVPAMLPMDVGDFTGRTDELAETLATLRGQRGGRRGVMLTGAAGIGKSALAIHAGYACRSDFSQGQLYIDLREQDGAPKKPLEVLGGFLRALLPGRQGLPATLDERVQLYRSLLAQRRVLVVLDNASADWQVRPLLPSGDSSRAVVTGRCPMPSVEGLHAVRLGRLDEPAALALLADVVGGARVADEPGPAGRVVELCDGLPLALRVCADRLRNHPGWRVADLVERLACDESRLDLLCEGSLDVRARLRAGVLELEPPSRDAFWALASMDAASFTAAEAAAHLGVLPRRAQVLLDALVDAWLLEAFPADGGRSAHRFPPLVGLLVREQTHQGRTERPDGQPQPPA